MVAGFFFFSATPSILCPRPGSHFPHPCPINNHSHPSGRQYSQKPGCERPCQQASPPQGTGSHTDQCQVSEAPALGAKQLNWGDRDTVGRVKPRDGKASQGCRCELQGRSTGGLSEGPRLPGPRKLPRGGERRQGSEKTDKMIHLNKSPCAAIYAVKARCRTD